MGIQQVRYSAPEPNPLLSALAGGAQGFGNQIAMQQQQQNQNEEANAKMVAALAQAYAQQDRDINPASGGTFLGNVGGKPVSVGPVATDWKALLDAVKYKQETDPIERDRQTREALVKSGLSGYAPNFDPQKVNQGMEWINNPGYTPQDPNAPVQKEGPFWAQKIKPGSKGKLKDPVLLRKYISDANGNKDLAAQKAIADGWDISAE